MGQFAVKYADAQGTVHNQSHNGASEQEVRDRLARQGFLVYTVSSKDGTGGLLAAIGLGGKKKLDVEKFLAEQDFEALVEA